MLSFKMHIFEQQWNDEKNEHLPPQVTLYVQDKIIKLHLNAAKLKSFIIDMD